MKRSRLPDKEALQTLREEICTAQDLVDNPLLSTALWLYEQQADFELRPGFLSSSRQRLLEKIRAESLPVGGQRVETPNRKQAFLRWLYQPDSFSRQVAVRVGILVLILFFMLSNSYRVTLAARTSFPGEPFYRVKVWKEEIQLAFSLTKAGDTDLNIDFAQRRLAETASLIFEARYEYIPATLSSFLYDEQQAVLAIREISRRNSETADRLAHELDRKVFQQVHVLGLLVDSVPPEERSLILELLQQSQIHRSELSDYLLVPEFQ